MIIFKKLILVVITLQLYSSTLGAVTIFDNPKISFTKPKNFSLKNNKKLHNCYSLLRKINGKNIYAGNLCAYVMGTETNLSDIGFAKYSDFPENSISFDAPLSGFVYSSPMSVYPVEIFKSNLGSAYTAKNVDCDVESTQEVYRASGACDVAFMLLPNNKALYINLVIKNDVKKLSISTHTDFYTLIKGLSILAK